MKVNSINTNTINNSYSKLSFKHSAVPYPEYEYAYYNSNSFLDSIAEKISQLFSPKVSKEADIIKNNIDNLYDYNNSKTTPQKQLLSVLA